MNFQDLKKVDPADTFLDIAFSRAKARANLARNKKAKDKFSKSKFVEITRIQNVEGSLVSKLDAIIKNFPSLDDLPQFYLELIRATIDYQDFKKSLGAMNWAIMQTRKFTSLYTKKINRCAAITQVNPLRREYYGRVSSVMKQIKDELSFLEDARKTMKGFPTIKTSMFTVAICGFPNIGKTTLLSKLTLSRPDISDYAFTTRRINVGYMKEEKIQLLDTPGTLNRPEKMNYIEKIAYLAMKYVADAYVYVFDLTEPYPLKDQVKLYKMLKKEKKEMLVYLSKTDILEDYSTFAEQFNAMTDSKRLSERLIKLKSSFDSLKISPD